MRNTILIAIVLTGCGGSSGLSGAGDKSAASSKKEVASKDGSTVGSGSVAGSGSAKASSNDDEKIVDAGSSQTVTGAFLVSCGDASDQADHYGPQTDYRVYGCALQNAAGANDPTRKISLVEANLEGGTVVKLDVLDDPKSGSKHQVLFELSPAVVGQLKHFVLVHTNSAGSDPMRTDAAGRTETATLAPVVLQDCAERGWKDASGICRATHLLSTYQFESEGDSTYPYETASVQNGPSGAIPTLSTSVPSEFRLLESAESCDLTNEDALAKCLDGKVDEDADGYRELWSVIYLGEFKATQPGNVIYILGREAVLKYLDDNNGIGWKVAASLGRLFAQRPVKKAPKVYRCSYSPFEQHTRFRLATTQTPPPGYEGPAASNYACLLLGYALPP